MVVGSQGAIWLEIGKFNGRMDQVSEKLDQIGVQIDRLSPPSAQNL